MSLFTKKQNSQNGKVLTPVFYPLKVEELHLAPYQREIRQSRVKSYADKYNPNIFGIILVSHRDGEYYIVDGQHRVEVAKLLGIKTVWCQVLEGLTYEQESEHFYQINDSKSRLNANHKFHSKVEAKDTEALEIVQALKKYRFVYSKEGNEYGDNIINAVGTLQQIYKNSGEDGLSLILEILRKAWNGDHSSLKAEIIKGLYTFVSNYTYDKNFLIQVLESYTPKGVSDRARAYTNNIRRPSEGACFHIAKTIRDLYEQKAIMAKNVAFPMCKIS